MRKQAGRILLLLLESISSCYSFRSARWDTYLDSTPIRVIRNWLSVATSLSIGLMELEILSVFVVLTNIKIVMSMHFMIYARMVVIALHIIGDFTYLADKIWFDSDALPYDYRTKPYVQQHISIYHPSCPTTASTKEQLKHGSLWRHQDQLKPIPSID
ncbi:hypothetical protein BSLG_003739 [Batrachochytrium salamandrivorans]|nr:hypothetical protein BSLG_003739 [Batrachochytrium salamandrivorans]